MSPIGHSILATSSAKKINTPLKASVVLLTSVILASCGSDSGSKSYYTSSSDIPTSSNTGDGNGSDNQAINDAIDRAEKAEKEADEARKSAKDAQTQLESSQAEIERLQGLIDEGNSNNEELQAKLDAVKA